MPVNILLDTAADRNYVIGKVVKHLRPTKVGEVLMSFNTFGNNTGKPKLYNLYNVKLDSREGEPFELKCIEVRNICRPITTHPLPPLSM